MLGEKLVKADVDTLWKRHWAASEKGKTTMTNIQTTNVLSDADLDAVVGGLPPVLAAFEIKMVERSNEPNAIKAMQIHQIEAATRWPFGRFWGLRALPTKTTRELEAASVGGLFCDSRHGSVRDIPPPSWTDDADGPHRRNQETDMNTQITLLSDDALDDVSGGRIALKIEGQPAIAGSSKENGQGSVSSGSNDLLNDFLLCAVVAVGATFSIFGAKNTISPPT
jgi:hypothetical protein